MLQETQNSFTLSTKAVAIVIHVTKASHMNYILTFIIAAKHRFEDLGLNKFMPL